MARYFSVEEAANLLGTTDRTVRRMLSSGRLQGSQHMDKGKLVWRVHASKEIIEKIPVGIAESEAVVDIEPAAAELNFEPDTKPEDWQRQGQSQAGIIAEQFWNELGAKFMERLEMKDQVIGSLQHELGEMERKLKLLPDLEKRAEEERKAAELKNLEAEALRKQIVAMEAERADAIEQERKAAQENEQAWKQQISALKEKQAAAIEQERRAAEAAITEIERVKAEKEAEARATQEKLADLSAKIEKLEQPWWRKWFIPSSD